MFYYSSKTRTLKLEQTYELLMAQGRICPGAGSRNLTFSLNSNILGAAQHIFSIEVNPFSTTIPIFNFTFTVSVNEVLKKSLGSNNTEPFVKIKSIDRTGLVVIAFSEQFLVPDEFSKLQELDLIIDHMQRPNLEVIVEPVEGQSPE